MLEELWLGKNKITQISGISTLVRLKRLDVQSNRRVFSIKLLGSPGLFDTVAKPLGRLGKMPRFQGLRCSSCACLAVYLSVSLAFFGETDIPVC